jgi:predicted XRE-type DNA-binding protein
MTETFESVWDAIEETPEQAAKMRAISDLMMQIDRIVRENKWSAAEAAERFRTRQERMQQLLDGRIDLFQFDDLLEMVAGLGRRVRIEIEAA